SDDIDQFGDEFYEDIDFEGFYQSNNDGLIDEENLLCDLIEKAQDCMNTEVDAKADALLNKFKKLQQEKNDRSLKILVFTEFRTTQKTLYDFLTNKGYSCTSINGSQDLDERKRAVSNFKNDAQILVATDAAGESLNMQFFHVIINYDLP